MSVRSVHSGVTCEAVSFRMITSSRCVHDSHSSAVTDYWYRACPCASRDSLPRDSVPQGHNTSEQQQTNCTPEKKHAPSLRGWGTRLRSCELLLLNGATCRKSDLSVSAFLRLPVMQLRYFYKVVQIWPGQTVTSLHTISPGHIWTTLYMERWKWNKFSVNKW